MAVGLILARTRTILVSKVDCWRSSLKGAHKACPRVFRTGIQKFGIDSLTSSTGMRVAYMQGLGEGLTVTELTDTSARDEVKALSAEVNKILNWNRCVHRRNQNWTTRLSWQMRLQNVAPQSQPWSQNFSMPMRGYRRLAIKCREDIQKKIRMMAIEQYHTVTDIISVLLKQEVK
jgi:hypothetical protein